MADPETTILHIVDPPAWGSSEADLRAFLAWMVKCERQYPGEYRGTIQDTRARIQAKEWEGFPPRSAPVGGAMLETIDAQAPLPMPEVCPGTLDDLLGDEP
jgi:hypothetical protein